MKKNKTIYENTFCLEGSEAKDNIVHNVKVLGINSKNGRVYPISVMEKALPMYENCIVNIDHPKSGEPRSFKDRFGRIKNARMEPDGIYGDLEYNNKHILAPAFEYFVSDDPQAVGLSHSAIARTRMDRMGNEIVEEIVELESVDIVAQPATNSGLFESYTKILETVMKKKKEAMDDKGSKNEVTLVEPGKKVYIPEAEDDGEGAHMMDDKVGETMLSMKEAIGQILTSSMSHDEKCEALMSVKADQPMEESTAKDVAIMDAEDDDSPADKKKKAEESIKLPGAPLGLKLLLEEMEGYRNSILQNAKIIKIKEFCKAEKLHDNIVTEAFIDVLNSVPEEKWARLVEDRKKISVSVSLKAPIGLSAEMVSGNQELTVESLMKALRS